ncbi:MAG: rhodanese-like domain-containing protein [Desulfobulbaceae bacterium]|nr:rhodanese-like domain-containing protein [Desulfobulbaceae bacterium]
MALKDFFTSIPTISAGDARRLIEGKGPDEYNLIDVRQPKEYTGNHLAGAKLIPLAELPTRIAEIDPNKPTIAY